MKKIFYVLFIFSCINTTAQTQDDIKLLTQFGINPHDTNIDIEHSIESITSDLKKLVNIGAKSLVFKRWNDMLMYYKSNDYNNYVLVSPDGSALEPPTNRGQLSQYMPINGRNYGLNYNNKDVQILLPGNKAPIISGDVKQKFTVNDCEKAIIGYLAAAIRYETRQDYSDNKTINSAENRQFIKGCYGSNSYENLEVISTDLPQVTKGTRLFKVLQKKLSIEDISYLLSGKDKGLPAGQNPYLPFIIIRK
jgi:hypothetical protein